MEGADWRFNQRRLGEASGLCLFLSSPHVGCGAHSGLNHLETVFSDVVWA